MKRLSIIVLCCLLGFSAAAVFASGKTEAATTAAAKTIVFWNGYTGPDRPAVEEIVRRFNESQSDVKVTMEISPWDSLFQKLMPAFIAGNAPDIVGYSVARLPEYAQAGRLEPLDQYLAASTSLKKDVLIPGLMNASVINGKLYGVPMAFASMIMYYNKDHFKAAGLDPENPPKTIAELEAAWKKLLVVDASGNVTRYPQAIGMRATVPMIPVFLWGNGADVVLADGKSGLASAQARQTMEYLQKAFRDLKVSPLGLTGQEADNLFAAGKASIEWNGPWALAGFRNAGINVGMAEVPAGPAGRFTWGGDTVLVMNKDSKAKDAAWKFMEYWNSADTQRYWAQTVAFPPTRTDLANDPALQSNKDLAIFMKAAGYAKIFLAGQSRAGQIEDEVLVPLFESIFRGVEKPDAALAKAHTALTKILETK